MVIATVGLSIPKIGLTGFGCQIAQEKSEVINLQLVMLQTEVMSDAK